VRVPTTPGSSPEECLARGPASWDAFFEHSGIKPILVLYQNFAADYETSTLNLLERLDLSCPDDFEFEPRMKRQSDRINDDWTRRYSELRLGRDFDLVPVPSEETVRNGP
jgi:LPS sulfotransferase NodH